MTKLLAAAAAALTLAVTFLASPARAAIAQNTLTVSANVIASCSIDAASLAFGNYDSAAALNGTGTVTVNCNQGTTYWIGLNLGANASGSTRRMQLAGSFLSYELYRDAGRSQVWDNADPGASGHLVAATTGAQPAITIYGQIPASQIVPTGNNYTDTVTMTVNF